MGGEAVPFVGTGVERIEKDAFRDSSGLETLEFSKVREASEVLEPHSFTTSLCSTQGSPS